MDFSSAYFGKPLSELTYEDIVEYFTVPRQESETIEFKSFPKQAAFDAGLQNVLKGISAFLNSTGGLLIWGAPKGVKEAGREDIFVGELQPVKDLREKDSLINRISSSIIPLPIGIAVQILSRGTDHLYIFEIQQSTYRPHQYDTRYYVRLDGQSKPAPHYLVDALMKRVTYPNLNGVIKFHEIQHDADGFYLNIEVGIFNFSVLQNEEQISFKILCDGGYFPRSGDLTSNFRRWHYNNEGTELTYDNFVSVLHYGNPRTYTDQIRIKTTQINKNDGMLSFLLSFGGKYSPAKASIYVLRWPSNIPRNTNELLAHVEENLLFADSLKKTPEDTLSSFLGR
ncbi:putative DNA-binding protein [Mucilaginibacter yixingensis]|uniref:Putative DNA-binding protein n=1 Tax=Mucilaginibacter yixingensis TaxID=1295612 RepID=A0A2T5J9T6_9SPHI|nr:ATP-binding protein [Mucilaginibacter yixingensis]PTQ96828.1 putative DNA-binding protein [Mucilaginibacter yixingensis]